MFRNRRLNISVLILMVFALLSAQTASAHYHRGESHQHDDRLHQHVASGHSHGLSPHHANAIDTGETAHADIVSHLGDGSVDLADEGLVAACKIKHAQAVAILDYHPCRQSQIQRQAESHVFRLVVYWPEPWSQSSIPVRGPPSPA